MPSATVGLDASGLRRSCDDRRHLIADISQRSTINARRREPQIGRRSNSSPTHLPQSDGPPNGRARPESAEARHSIDLSVSFATAGLPIPPKGQTIENSMRERC
jgi:hypothetical protein